MVGGGGVAGGGGIELICLLYMWVQFWVLRVHSTATRLQVTHVHDTAGRRTVSAAWIDVHGVGPATVKHT